MLGILGLPICFSIECPSGSEANSLILEEKIGGKMWYDAKIKLMQDAVVNYIPVDLIKSTMFQ